MLLAREVPMIAFLLLGGVFADRISRRTILMTAPAVNTASPTSPSTD